MGVHKQEYLTPQQIEAIQLMVEGELTRQQIADKVGCARSTLYQWLSEEKFKESLIKFSDRLIIDARCDSLRRIKALATQDEDKRTAFASARFLCELNGLSATTKIDLNTTDNIRITIDDGDTDSKEQT
jgi:predicted DNA-binding protein (UPF0251 family)